MKAVLLVGGTGTRLRSEVPFLPKPLAPLGERPFLELLIKQLKVHGIVNLVMCTGYRAEEIEKAFGSGEELGVEIEYSKELSPLGTAGALKQAGRYLQNEPEFIVLNGDSFLEIDFHEFIKFHREHTGLASIAVVQVHNATRYGTVEIAAGSRVAGFVEKDSYTGSGIINAGIYLFKRDVLQDIPSGPCSLERDVIPRLLYKNIYAFDQQGFFIDIGTPADYALARQMCDRLTAICRYANNN